MGGETCPGSWFASFFGGLSPRGRGNRRKNMAHPRSSRSIPAWAGKPYPLGFGPIPTGVYPRVGGETV